VTTNRHGAPKALRRGGGEALKPSWTYHSLFGDCPACMKRRRALLKAIRPWLRET